MYRERKIGDGAVVANCKHCKKIFEISELIDGRCPSCADYYQLRLNERRSLTRKPKKKKKAVVSIDEICKAAREKGMTYGKYMEWIQSGQKKIEC